MTEKEPQVERKLLYCEECKESIPVDIYSDGVVHILCPKCTGECSQCDCHLQVSCFQDSPQVIVRAPDIV